MSWKFFADWEFECKCGCGLNNTSKELVDRLDLARALANVPFSINSGSRCPSHNKKEGGSITSSHLNGTAVDIACTRFAPRFRIVAGLIRAGFTRIGIAKTFIHADCDPDKQPGVVWLYK